MSLTEPAKESGRRLAEELFDGEVARLAAARGGMGKPGYFPLRGEAEAESYFELPLLRAMTPADFEFPGDGTPAGLVEAVAASWVQEGEADLAAMAPRFHEIAEALRDEADEGDGSVNILCYTLF